MREAILRDLFLGLCSVQQLRDDLEGSVERSADTSQYDIEDMDTDFEVKPEHLIALCDAVLSGELPPESLQAVGFCLISSDHFGWDSDTEPGSRVAATVHDWSSPETRDPLTMENIRKFRERLSPGRDSGG